MARSGVVSRAAPSPNDSLSDVREGMETMGREYVEQHKSGQFSDVETETQHNSDMNE